MLHVEEQLRRAIRVGSHDHLLSGVDVMLEMRRSLRPTGMTGVHFEPASIERKEIVDFVQFMDLGAELLRQIKIVRGQLVLGIVAATDATIAARDATGAPRSDSTEVWIVGVDPRATEVDAYWSLVERLASPYLDRDLLKGPIDVGWHVRITHDAEHSGCLIDTRREFVAPIRDTRPRGSIEELPGRDIQGVAIDMRAAANARSSEYEHIIEVFDPLNAIQFCCRKP
jgi:hypothetical protein